MQAIASGRRVADSLPAVATPTTATACTSSDQPARAKTPHAAVASTRPGERFRPLLQQSFPDVKRKTFTSAVGDFPPNARATPHHHGKAFVYANVLGSTARSQPAGQPVSTYRQGENWVEQPGTQHVLTENTGRAEPAKLLIVFASNTGDPITQRTPACPHEPEEP